MYSHKTLAVAILFALLVGYIYFFELKKDLQQKGEKLLNFAPEEVASLVLQSDLQDIRLQRQDSRKWQMTSPLQARADESAVTSLLAELSAAEVTRTLVPKPTPEELKSFGLEQPSARVSITLKSGVTLPAILVGSRTPLGHSVYIRREVKPDVLLTQASLAGIVGKQVKDFRDKRILEIKDDAVRQLTLKKAKGQLTLIKKGGEWHIDAPRDRRADSEEVRGFIHSLENLMAQDFIEAKLPDFSKYGLDRPRLQITVTQNDRQVEVSVGKQTEGRDQVYLASNNAATVYTVSEKAVQALDKDWDSFRDRHLLVFSPATVAKLEVQNANESFTLAKDDKQWRFEPAREGSLQVGAVEGWVATLSRLKATRILEDESKIPEDTALIDRS